MSDMVEERGLKARLPILPAIAYPAHLLYVPPPLWGVNCAVWTIVSIAVGQALHTVFEPEIVLIGGIPTHLWLMWTYRRNPFCWEEWVARYLKAEPMAGIRRTTNLQPRRGVNRFV